MNRTAILLSSLCVLASLSAFAAESDSKKSPAEMEKRAEERFKKSDINGDGALTKEEYLARSEKRFTEIDANQDGKIAPKEMKTYRAAKKAAREKRMAEKAKKTVAATAK